MKKNNIWAIIVLFISMFTQAQQIEYFNGNEYLKIDNEWKLLSKKDLKHYKVVSNSISVKYNTNTEQQIIAIEQQHNLTRLRKSLTGWHDYETPTNGNIFEISRNLNSNSIVIHRVICSFSY